jgi:bifunctional non-homologous end joining protein LigD
MYTSAMAPAGPRPVIAGVGISNPGRVMFPRDEITKRDLARYYDTVAEWMLPHTRGRPLTLFRCARAIGPDCYFMKHSKVWAPEALRRVRIPERAKIGEYLIADTPAALVALAQMDVIEIHTWNARVEHLEQPDRIVFDLDPGAEVSWPEVVQAARRVRAVLDALGLVSFPKTTGGRGLHLVVPLVPERGWQECLAFSRSVATAIARKSPSTFTVAYARAGRERKILLDYLRNNRTNTSVAAYSVRAREGAPVSIPIAWGELSPQLRPEAFTLRNVPRRLARRRADPWSAYWKCDQRLTPDAFEALARV